MNSKEQFMKEEGTAFPGKTYVETLLKPLFNDQKNHLFDVMFRIHRAHVVMLAEQGILTKQEAKTILTGVNKVAEIDHKTIEYSPEFEDLFFMMEFKIGEEVGSDLAGKMHIARSRNDMGEAMYRLVLRDLLLDGIHQMALLGSVLLEQAEVHLDTILTAHTHTQPAQPTTLGHYLTAIYDVVERDIVRFWNAFETVNRSPMGAAAITTTGFPINRERVCELLGFDGIMENSYDAIGGGDYLLDSATVIITAMTNTGRWVQDFLKFATTEFGILQVADPYVQISSIMPQKRNPVSIEHSRSLASSAVGEALSVVQMIHNTPYGDIVDTEDDLQPHLYRGFEKSSRVFKLMRAVITTMIVDKDKAKQRTYESCITITELADELARHHQVPFRTAHKIASLVANQTMAEKKILSDWKVDEINTIIIEQTGTDAAKLTEKQWQAIICPEMFVRRRSIRGGPNPLEVKRMIATRKVELNSHIKRYQEITSELLKRNEKLMRIKLHS
ncbi:argininosuccinate lyase [Bacillus pakistanensis]|uniref:Argininosuccinate lyase n=1 Tax=Rossellomorea pakistanensis TaxID=992288 RepID=A0ABS2N720_9BACI|nr:argininosuccinate lyase [Bacillus pakistanensis]